MSRQEKVIVTMNGGSSSVKYAAFAMEAGGAELRRVVAGNLERVGDQSPAVLAERVAKILHEKIGRENIAALGHRVVHGGMRVQDHQRITPALLQHLREAVPLDLTHLPGEIALLEAFEKLFPGVPQVACFDTVFHRDLPAVAKMLPIPRKYFAAGVRRFGFHGLSYSYLMQELERVAGEEAARGKIILAHLGSGASMAAVRGGAAIETTMGFTPLSGLVMGTRPGDVDAGLLTYLMRTEDLSAQALDEMLSRRCGLAGISGTSSDMRDLLKRRSADNTAAEAVELFCYRARQWIGGLAAALGGLDTLVFSGGIGEHAAEVRAEICAGLEFLSVRIDAGRNARNNAIISACDSAVTVRVMATDEEVMIARITASMTQGDHDARSDSGIVAKD